MKLLQPKENHVWHLRIQRWANGKRLRRVPYRVVAHSAQDAVDKMIKRLGGRGLISTRIAKGKQV